MVHGVIRLKKKWCDTLSIIFLVLGIITLPFLKGHFGMSDNLMTVIVCGGTIISILLLKVIGYKTGYSEEERKEDRINFWILLLLLCGVLLVGAFGLF